MSLFFLDGVSPRLPDDGSAWIAPNAAVIGNVVLGRDVGIWFGAVLRGDNETIAVGDGTNVQDLCCFHTDEGFPLTIGQDCTVGHRAILHGCTIGDNVLIGMGATVLNGAVIGDNAIIGAGALVAEGKTIPANSLAVGLPAKVVRELDDASAKTLRVSAAHYVANARRFANGLEPNDRD